MSTSSCRSISAGSSPFTVPLPLSLLHSVSPGTQPMRCERNAAGYEKKTSNVNVNSPCSLQPLHQLPQLERLRLLRSFPDLMYPVVLRKQNKRHSLRCASTTHQAYGPGATHQLLCDYLRLRFLLDWGLPSRRPLPLLPTRHGCVMFEGGRHGLQSPDYESHR